MIYITGDLHGNINDERLSWLKDNLDKNDILIVLGDFGFFFFKDLINQYPDFPFITIAILGNHENYSILNTFKKTSIFNAKARLMKDKVYIIDNGEILNIDDKSFFVFGGALSIDKVYRVPYISWWPQEQPTISEFNNAVSNLEKINYNIDYFLAHDVDRDIASKMFNKQSIINSSTSDMLRELEFKIKDNSNKKYEYFFGHWHEYSAFGENIKYTCLYNQIYCLDKKETLFF